MTRERRLGRGLEALLGSEFGDGYSEGQAESVNTEEGVRAGGDGTILMRVDRLERNPFQPRETFDETEIAELATSLIQYGLLQPILARQVGEQYQIVAGERRLRAAQHAGWAEVPVRIVAADDRRTAELAIVENLQRRDLDPLEKAVSFQRYMQKFHCTQEDLAGRLQIDRSTVANLVRLLELPAAVQQAVRNGAISQGHARALLPLGDEREQVSVCEKIQAEQLSVRQVESLVQETIHQADAEPLAVVGGEQEGRPAARTRNQHLASVAQELKMALGAKVEVRQSGKEAGRIVVHFTSHAEFDRLRQYLLAAPVPEQRNQAG